MKQTDEIQNDFDFNVDISTKNAKSIKTLDQYQSYKLENLHTQTKKKSLFNLLELAIEIILILIAFIFIIKKAMNIIIKNNKPHQPVKSSTQNLLNSQKNETTLIPSPTPAPEPKKEEKIIKKTDIKVCLCTPCKKENRYIKEFVEFYKDWGVDKIFLYDNNEKDGEKMDEVLHDYIKNGFVEIYDWRGKYKILMNMMDDCYQRNNRNYDWLLFYETDEFLHLKNYTNIKKFLKEDKFDNCKKIHLNWVFHTDNDQYHYDERPVRERFPIIEPKPRNVKGLRHVFFKTMIRGNLSNIKIDCVHKLVKSIKGCNGYGKEAEINGVSFVEQDFENYYIDHYFSRSVDEFIDKLNKGDSIRGHDIRFKIGTFGNYFGFNNMTINKISYVEKRTGLNLSIYKQILRDRNKTKSKTINKTKSKTIKKTKSKTINKTKSKTINKTKSETKTKNKEKK